MPGLFPAEVNTTGACFATRKCVRMQYFFIALVQAGLVSKYGLISSDSDNVSVVMHERRFEHF